MKLSEFLRFKILRYPPDMKTAWVLNAMKKSDDPEEVSNFKTVDGNYVRTTYGNLFNAAREHVTLDNASGEVYAFTWSLANPAWECNGETIYGDHFEKTVPENSKITLSWDYSPQYKEHWGIESKKGITLDLKQLKGVFGEIELDGNCEVKGNLSDLKGRAVRFDIGPTVRVSELYGDLKDFKNNISKLTLECPEHNITGDLSSISSIGWLELKYTRNITGDLGVLTHSIAGALRVAFCPNIHGVYVPKDYIPNITDISYSGCTTEDVDNMLIAYAEKSIEIGASSCLFRGTGMFRTPKSDSAVETLLSRDFKIQGISRI